MATGDPTQRRRLARLVFTALLLGLMLNLGVAWGLSLIPHWLGPADSRTGQLVWYEEPGGRVTFFSHTHRWVGVEENQFHTVSRSRDRNLPSQRSVWWSWHPFVPTHDAREKARTLFDEFAQTNRNAKVISHTRYGFPAFTLQGRSVLDDSTLQPNGTYHTSTRGVFFDRISPSTNPGAEVWPHAQHLWLPYHPIWSGLAVNTLIYAVLVAILGYTVARVRNARRMLRGYCPYCAYELHHNFSHGCPECGWRHATSTPDNSRADPQHSTPA